MRKQYTVIEEFKVKDAKIVVLNENQTLADSQKPLVLAEGKTYPYQLTHNENWIIVKADFDFKDKQVEFVGEGEYTHDISDKLTEWPEIGKCKTMAFEEEMQALGDWLMAETERCMSIPEIPGVLDGESSTELKKVTREHNRKLSELKERYNIQ